MIRSLRLCVLRHEDFGLGSGSVGAVGILGWAECDLVMGSRDILAPLAALEELGGGGFGRFGFL